MKRLSRGMTWEIGQRISRRKCCESTRLGRVSAGGSAAPSPHAVPSRLLRGARTAPSVASAFPAALMETRALQVGQYRETVLPFGVCPVCDRLGSSAEEVLCHPPPALPGMGRAAWTAAAVSATGGHACAARGRVLGARSGQPVRVTHGAPGRGDQQTHRAGSPGLLGARCPRGAAAGPRQAGFLPGGRLGRTPREPATGAAVRTSALLSVPRGPKCFPARVSSSSRIGFRGEQSLSEAPRSGTTGPPGPRCLLKAA